MKTCRRAAVAALVLAASPTLVSAQATDRESQYWIGISAGSATLGDDRCNPELFFVRDDSICDDRDTGFKLHAGKTLNDYLGAEAIVAKLGEAFFQTSIFSRGLGSIDLPVEGAHNYSVGFAATTHMAVNRLDLYLKFGIQWWDRSFSIFDEESDVNTDGFDLIWGLGGQYPINNRFGIRAELERFVIDDYDLNFRSAGIVRKF